MTTKISANKAAAEVRAKVLRKMNELQGLEKPQTRFNLQKQWESLRTYVKGMALRASKKPGGLGKR